MLTGTWRNNFCSFGTVREFNGSPLVPKPASTLQFQASLNILRDLLVSPRRTVHWSRAVTEIA